MRVDKAESVDDYFPLHRLNGIDDHSDRSRVKRLKRLIEMVSDERRESLDGEAYLLGIDVHA